MLVLCLDTATADVAAAAVDLDDPARCAVRVVRDARAAGELLMPLATAALADVGAAPREPAAVLVGLGPGPYTGLRVGVVTAALFAAARDIPAYGLCSLDLWAQPATGPDGPRGTVVVTDARRREVFWACYDASGTRTDGPQVSSPAQLAERLAGDLAGFATLGPGLSLYPQLARPAGGAPDDHDRPVPVDRLAVLLRRPVLTGAPTQPLVPIYLRRPDAVPLAGQPAAGHPVPA